MLLPVLRGTKYGTVKQRTQICCWARTGRVRHSSRIWVSRFQTAPGCHGMFLLGGGIKKTKTKRTWQQSLFDGRRNVKELAAACTVPAAIAAFSAAAAAAAAVAESFDGVLAWWICSRRAELARRYALNQIVSSSARLAYAARICTRQIPSCMPVGQWPGPSSPADLWPGSSGTRGRPSYQGRDTWARRIRIKGCTSV